MRGGIRVRVSSQGQGQGWAWGEGEGEGEGEGGGQYGQLHTRGDLAVGPRVEGAHVPGQG